MYYKAQVVSISDYYPFGMRIEDRAWEDSTFSYRFGFNGQEKDNEVRGKGNSLHFGSRSIYDPRLARFVSVDPMWRESASWTPYSFAANKPIICVDQDGENPIIYLIKGAAGGAIDGMMQFAINLAVYEGDATKAFNNIDWQQVALSAGQSMLPWSPPGGKYGQAAIDALSDVLINYYRGNYNNLTGSDLTYAILNDFLTGYIASAGANSLGDALPAVRKWLNNNSSSGSKSKPKPKTTNPPAEVNKQNVKKAQTSSSEKATTKKVTTQTTTTSKPVSEDLTQLNPNSPAENHHIVPKQIKDIEPVQQARDGGFKYDGAENKVRVPKYDQSGNTFHANHPNWTRQVREHMQEMYTTETWQNMTDEQRRDYVIQMNNWLTDVIKQNFGIRGINEIEIPFEEFSPK